MQRRYRHHLALGSATAAILTSAALANFDASAADRLSFVSAYLCLVLLAAALLIGPWQVRRAGQPVLNIHLRRDIGIWSGLNGLLHFWLANVLAMNYRYVGIFVDQATNPPTPAIRQQLFSWGTILGYVMAVIILILLGLSSDRALRKVGTAWWKRLQRLSYFGFIATVLHALAFQLLESRTAVWVVVVTAIALGVAAMQWLGVITVRRDTRRKEKR